MGHVDNCLGTLRYLISAGDMNGIQLAEAAIEEYWAATPAKAEFCTIGVTLLVRRNLATTVDAFIEKKLTA
jgi:hypothetical protein